MSKKRMLLLLLVTFIITPCVMPADQEDEENTEEILEEVPDTEGDIYKIKTQHAEAPEKYDKSWLGKIKLKNKDINMYLGGMLRDEYFVYNRVNTLRENFFDHNNFFRHKMSLDWSMDQGKKRYGSPATEAFVRLSNYIYWQNNDAYTPLAIENLRSEEMNLSLAKNVHVKTFMPLIFAEQAWLRINFDAFTELCKDNQTFIKAGLFDYAVGRGIALGYHADMAVENLGWPGAGDFTRFAYMPPGILFRTELTKNLSLDFYYSKWREVSATLDDTTLPTRKQRLFGPRPERGKGKDRDVWVVKADYNRETESAGTWLAEPYWVYCNAPEQQIEFLSDASAHLNTLGVMFDVTYNNFKVNVELAGQLGHQQVHGIDRNEIVLNSKGQPVLSHVFLSGQIPVGTVDPRGAISRAKTPVRSIVDEKRIDDFKIENQIDFIVNTPENRNICRQGKPILNNGTPLVVNQTTGFTSGSGTSPANLFNSNVFGNKRFRNPYKLENRGVMALADMSYEFDDIPLKLAGALGYIGGSEYPYNEEVCRSLNGFIPLRSWYKGLAVENILIFDRLVIPRPMNISYRTMYAFNHTKNLSDLQYLGLGATWYPARDRSRCAISAETMFLWKVAEIYKWDKCGKHPDPAIETQIAIDRKLLGFSGWESTQKAHRMLGAELDLKAIYRLVDNLNILAKIALFFPGKLYSDLDGQPNIVTRRVDACGRSQYESLGSSTAFAFICGFDYRF